MNFKNFSDECYEFWIKLLGAFSAGLANGRIRTPAGITTLFPTMLVTVECPGHYVCELYGATPSFSGLSRKKISSPSIESYFDPFCDFSAPSGTIVHFGEGGNMGFSGMRLSRVIDLDAVRRRFPFVDLWQSAFVLTTEANGPLLTFDDKFRDCHLDDCLFISRRDNIYRCKMTHTCLVVRSTINRPDLDRALKEYDKPPPVFIYPARPEDSFIAAAQFQALALVSGVNETALTDFVREHPQIVESAFNARSAVHQPRLLWIEKPLGLTDSWIQPDLMIQRQDGLYDIVDFKLPGLEKRSITKGPFKRRRFIDYVDEGIAQVAHYRDYFRFERNREYAKATYGIEVGSQPKSIVVVGNSENADAEQVAQALRPFSDIEVVDYDSLAASLFVRLRHSEHLTAHANSK